MRAIALVVASVLLPACSEQPPGYDAEFEREVREEWDRRKADYDRDLKRAAEQMDRYDRQLDKGDEQNARLDALLDRWEAQADRYEKILEAWEKSADK